MNDKKHFIYGLFEGEKPRYVGQTINPERRKREHSLGRSRLGQLSVGMTFKILGEAHPDDVNRIEMQLVNELREKGFVLFNENTGTKGLPKRHVAVKSMNRMGLLIETINGLEIREPVSGGKAGKGHNKSSTIRIFENSLFKNQFRFWTDRPETKESALSRARRFCARQPAFTNAS